MVIYVGISSRNGQQGDDEVWPLLRIKYPWSIPSLPADIDWVWGQIKDSGTRTTHLTLHNAKEKKLQCSEIARMS